MPDREKVIMAIEICIKSGCKDGIPNKLCPYSSEVGCDLNQILADALELLKEQETANLYKCPNCGTWVSAENVVRCKNCKHLSSPANGVPFCKHIKNFVDADWFCADGKRTENAR